MMRTCRDTGDVLKIPTLPSLRRPTSAFFRQLGGTRGYPRFIKTPLRVFSVSRCAITTVAALAVACSGGGGADAPTGPTQPASISTVLVSGRSTLEVGATTQMVVVVRDASGTTLSGRVVSWSSSTPGVATVSDGGLVTALTPGSVTITASAEGKSGNISVSISNVPVATVALTPASGSLYVGESAAFVVTLKDVSGNVLTGRQVNWNSSNPNVASVTTNGLLNALAAGTSTISVSSEGRSAVVVLTVLTRPAEAAPVATITLSPSVGLFLLASPRGSW